VRLWNVGYHGLSVTRVDDIASHQLVLDTMPVLLTLFTSRRHSSTQLTVQLLRTLSLVCHRNRVAQVHPIHALALSVCLSVCLTVLRSLCLSSLLTVVSVLSFYVDILLYLSLRSWRCCLESVSRECRRSRDACWTRSRRSRSIACSSLNLLPSSSRPRQRQTAQLLGRSSHHKHTHALSASVLSTPRRLKKRLSITDK